MPKIEKPHTNILLYIYIIVYYSIFVRSTSTRCSLFLLLLREISAPRVGQALPALPAVPAVPALGEPGEASANMSFNAAASSHVEGRMLRGPND